MTVVHLHSHLARGAFGTKKLEAWWDFLRDHINQYGVKVLMGDFNMSVTRVIPALRSRGVVIDLASFYAWKDLDGNPMADSCGTFMVNCPGHHAPFPSREKLNATAPDGWFAPAPPAVAGPAAEQEDRLYDRLPAEGGPGQKLSAYLGERNKKDHPFEEKFSQSWQPDPASVEAMRAEKGKGKGFAHERVPSMRTKQKRIDFTMWALNAIHYGGAHYPHWAITDFAIGFRSDGSLRRRADRALAKGFVGKGKGRGDPADKGLPKGRGGPGAMERGGPGGKQGPDLVAAGNSRGCGGSTRGPLAPPQLGPPPSDGLSVGPSVLARPPPGNEWWEGEQPWTRTHAPPQGPPAQVSGAWWPTYPAALVPSCQPAPPPQAMSTQQLPLGLPLPPVAGSVMQQQQLLEPLSAVPLEGPCLQQQPCPLPSGAPAVPQPWWPQPPSLQQSPQVQEREDVWNVYHSDGSQTRVERQTRWSSLE